MCSGYKSQQGERVNFGPLPVDKRADTRVQICIYRDCDITCGIALCISSYILGLLTCMTLPYMVHTPLGVALVMGAAQQ